MRHIDKVLWVLCGGHAIIAAAYAHGGDHKHAVFYAILAAMSAWAAAW